MIQRPVQTVAIESVIIGLMNAALIYIVSNAKFQISTPMIHMIAGALIHILFEYSGANAWWCRTTY
jgi:hypothetical protein